MIIKIKSGGFLIRALNSSKCINLDNIPDFLFFMERGYFSSIRIIKL